MTYQVATSTLTVLCILALWKLVWKGIALWRSSRRAEPGWFAALLVINSAGVLPIVYLWAHHKPAHIAHTGAQL